MARGPRFQALSLRKQHPILESILLETAIVTFGMLLPDVFWVSSIFSHVSVTNAALLSKACPNASARLAWL